MDDQTWHPLLRSALAVLALPPEKQIGAFRPEWCIPHEILDDFDNAQRVALAIGNQLSEGQTAALVAINKAMDSMQPDDIQDNNKVLFRPAWQRLRDLAQVGLRAFGWEAVVVRPCTESPTSPGVWEGPSAD